MLRAADAKQVLRATLLDHRKGLAAAHPDAGNTAASLAPPELYGFKCAAGYHPIRAEIDPAPLMRALAARGVALCLPSARPGQALDFRHWSPGDPLSRGRYGIEEPHEDSLSATPDLIIVPLAAFDPAGHRLGYGAGHFDRTLAALRLSGTVFALGLAYAEQEVAAVPFEPHDQKLDAVLTEKGYRPFA